MIPPPPETDVFIGKNRERKPIPAMPVPLFVAAAAMPATFVPCPPFAALKVLPGGVPSKMLAKLKPM